MKLYDNCFRIQTVCQARNPTLEHASIRQVLIGSWGDPLALDVIQSAHEKACLGWVARWASENSNQPSGRWRTKRVTDNAIENIRDSQEIARWFDSLD